jgi:hypothetical protein
MHTCPIGKEAKETELSTKNILQNNEYNENIVEKLPHPPEKEDTQNQKTKWSTFTYSGKEVRKITRLFRDTEMKIAFRTKNTIQNILRPHTQTDTYNKNWHLPNKMPRLST